MLGLKSSVPKFGNWEKNDDSSYSIVFDKIRAERESSLHFGDIDCDDVSSITSASPRSNGQSGNMTSQSLLRGKKEKPLHTAKENKRLARFHKEANFEGTAERGAFHDSSGMNDLAYRSPTFSSWQAAVTRDHQNIGSQPYFYHLQATPQSPLGAPTYNPLPVSGVPLTQLKQSGATIEREHSDPDDKGYKGQHHTKLPSSGRGLYREEQGHLKRRSFHESFDMQGNPTVPKFGDWAHGDGFTALFDTVRKERSSKKTSRPTVEVGPLQMEEDLYKGSQRLKHRRSWASILCCSGSLS